MTEDRNFMFLEVDDRHVWKVDVDWKQLFKRPAIECCAVLYMSPVNWKVGRFYPGDTPLFASASASPDEIFRGVEKLRRRRPVNPRCGVFPVLELHTRFPVFARLNAETV